MKTPRPFYTVRRRFLVVLACLGAVAGTVTIFPIDQEIEVGLLFFGNHFVSPMCESGQRLQYIRSLLKCGEAGKREARRYVAREVWKSPPQSYDISMLCHAKLAFLGLSQKEVSALIGKPNKITESEGVTSLLYLGQVDPFGIMRPRLIFQLRQGRVEDVSRWAELVSTGECFKQK